MGMVFFVVIVGSLVALVLLLSPNFSNFTGNVISQSENYVSVGDNLSGELSLDIKRGESFSEASPIMLILSREGEIVYSDTLTLGDFMGEIDSEIFDIQGEYSIDVSELMNYTFEEAGDYELLFLVFDFDVTAKSKFIVE